MRTLDLIAKLQLLVEQHRPMEDVMGDHEIVIDVFKDCGQHKFQYAGFSPHIIIEKSSDGTYDILSAFAQSQPPKDK